MKKKNKLKKQYLKLFKMIKNDKKIIGETRVDYNQKGGSFKDVGIINNGGTEGVTYNTFKQENLNQDIIQYNKETL